MDSRRFYAELPSFRDFRRVAADAPFRPLPADWTLFVADVEGSTSAIEAGRYKDINTVGAAAVAAAQNAMGRRDFPFVFGGDGASLAVPPDSRDEVSSALDGVRALARNKFGLALRVGAVKAAERIKGDPRRYAVPERAEHRSDLTGLSCRWKPIPSEKGSILSIMIDASARKDPMPVYEEVLRRLDAVFSGDLLRANPVHMSTMGYRTVWENIKDERRCHRSALSPAFLVRAAGIVASVLVSKWRVSPPAFDERGDVRYGLHESSAALMTCFVYDTDDGSHIHFIDGGYAMAAKQLKAQPRGT